MMFALNNEPFFCKNLFMMKTVASTPAFEFETSGSKFDFHNEKTIVSS